MNPPARNALEPAPVSTPEDAADSKPAAPESAALKELGGRKDGTDPTRFGDWEKGGRCIDF